MINGVPFQIEAPGELSTCGRATMHLYPGILWELAFDSVCWKSFGAMNFSTSHIAAYIFNIRLVLESSVRETRNPILN